MSSKRREGDGEWSGDNFHGMSVYKHYSQEQLDNQYNTRLLVPDYAEYFERWEKLSRQTEKEHTVFKNVSYGDHSQETLDIFPAEKTLSKTLVFIHGGYWHLLDKEMFHFLASGFLEHNITTVLINYPLAPHSSIDEIVSSCRRGMQWLQDNVKRFNGDPSQLYILGHSAGGHLASMLLLEKELKFIKAVISLSGIFRLEPIKLSYLNDTIGMDHEAAIRNSPVLITPVNDCQLLLVVGSDETNEFKEQTEELYKCWKNKCSSPEFLEIAGKNHYSILDAVVEKESVLHDTIVRLLSSE